MSVPWRRRSRGVGPPRPPFWVANITDNQAPNNTHTEGACDIRRLKIRCAEKKKMDFYVEG